jgi:hypothetical protein
MSGAHRAATANPGVDVLKSVRFLLPLAAVIAAPGAIVYLIVAGTELELSGAAWVLTAAVFIAAMAHRQRDHVPLRWSSASSVLLTTGLLTGALAHHRGWEAGPLHLITLASPGLYPAAAALGVVAVVMGTRFGRFPWRRRPSAGE